MSSTEEKTLIEHFDDFKDGKISLDKVFDNDS